MAVEPSENPTYKLHYFNIMGLAEPLRLLFAYGGIEYEDIRVEFEDWPTLKPTMPMGQMPVVEIDDQRVHQSISIGRYLSKRIGLAGANDWENLLIDIAVDTINDFRLKIVAAYYEPDEAVKERKFEAVKNEVVPFYLEKLDAMAGENDGYFALGRLSFADIFFVGISDYLKYVLGSDITDNYENLKRVMDNVTSVESIKTWLEERPKTDF